MEDAARALSTAESLAHHNSVNKLQSIVTMGYTTIHTCVWRDDGNRLWRFTPSCIFESAVGPHYHIASGSYFAHWFVLRQSIERTCP